MPSLNALTTAALVLPGLVSPVSASAAEGDEVDFQYSHYQEGKRDISLDLANDGKMVGAKNTNPIEVDSLRGSARITLTDRIKFAFNYIQDTWGGATPVSTTPYLFSGNRALIANDLSSGASPWLGGNKLIVDANYHPLDQTVQPFQKVANSTKLTHIMATASPETRKQGDFKLSYDWDNAGLSVGGGISVEDDYESRFGNIGARFDFNQKRTTVNTDLSYTNSYTHATPEHYNFVNYDFVPENQLFNPNNDKNWNVIYGTRQDWASHLGVSHVLNKDAILGADFSYTRSTGYLSNPYKGVSVLFVDPSPTAAGDLFSDAAPAGSFLADIKTFVEKRPEVRNQYSVGGRYVQFIEPLNAALHFNYQFSADDWGIQSHTFDADWVQPLGSGWTITPRVRYYSQDAASFYTPYLISNQAYESSLVDPVKGQVYKDFATGQLYYDDLSGTVAPPLDGEGNPIVNPFSGNVLVDGAGNPVSDSNVISGLGLATKTYDKAKLPNYFSSDHRLSGFGALSGGVTIAKQFAKGLTLETGFEYYTHQGSLKIGGGGEANYADFDYWLANAALKVNLDALQLSHGGGADHDGHSSHHAHAAHEPAGVMFGHMLPKAGDFMVGYRYMWNSQGGGMVGGSSSAPDSAVVANGCNEPGSLGCILIPTSMSMSMHMLDLMYAPTDWLTLMLMPQFVDMHMDMSSPYADPQAAGISDLPNGFGLSAHFTHHIQNPHESGGIGDLGMYALFKLFDNGTHHLHATAGISAPTGDANLKFRRSHGSEGGFMDYGMQLGSGTWDFRPSVTYTGHTDDFSWGAQANGIVRMENKNDSGYRLGDMFQGTVWGGYNVTNWLTATVRGVYTVQGSIHGQFNGSAGGQFKDQTRVCSTQQQSTLDEFGNEIITEVPVYCDSSILKFGPNDYPQNYGGRFWDVGFGLSATVPSGDFAGNRLAVEWLQPVYTDFNGYQLGRDGALSATWSVMF